MALSLCGSAPFGVEVTSFGEVGGDWAALFMLSTTACVVRTLEADFCHFSKRTMQWSSQPRFFSVRVGHACARRDGRCRERCAAVAEEGQGAAFAENVVIESFTVPCTVHQVRAWTGKSRGVARPSRFLSFVWTISHDAPAIAGALWLTVTRSHHSGLCYALA